MDQSLKVHDFVLEWLNHFNIRFDANIDLNSTLTIDFLVREFGFGIYIVDWKRPISVTVANKAIQIQRELELDTLYLVSREISEPAHTTLQKFGENIISVHPNGLSELAINLANTVQPQKSISVSQQV